jgi:hypothetical protein
MVAKDPSAMQWKVQGQKEDGGWRMEDVGRLLYTKRYLTFHMLSKIGIKPYIPDGVEILRIQNHFLLYFGFLDRKRMEIWSSCHIKTQRN